MNTKVLRALAASSVLGGALVALAPEITSASVRPHSIAAFQQKLEGQLAARASQLNRLNADITAAKSLSSAHATALTTDVSTALTNINALIAKVPTDTTNAQLRADSNSMVKQNRVYAVLTPQVFLTIQADDIAAQVTTLQGSEQGLLSAVNGLVGKPGYTSAMNRYTSFVKLVNNANLNASNVATRVLAQTPANFPGDTKLFVGSNRALLNANLDLAHANYDASIIGFASGGYTGN